MIKPQDTNNNQATITKPANKRFDLEERTLKFAIEVIKICKELPLNVINQKLVGQLINSGGSIGANYREANDALSKKDFYHRIKITRKEAKETIYWLQLLETANASFSKQINTLLKESQELKNIFSSIANRQK